MEHTFSCISQIGDRLRQNHGSFYATTLTLNTQFYKTKVEDALHCIPIVDNVAPRLIHILRLAARSTIGVDIGSNERECAV